jgi:hypothetical protein
VPAPIPFEMNDRLLARRIAELARDSSRVVLLPHAKRRMQKRGVSYSQVLQVLTKGVVVEPAHRDVYGYWKCTLSLLVAGDRIKVAAVLQEDQGAKVVVITVMN